MIALSDAPLVIFTYSILLTTVIPLSKSTLWWVRCWDFPRQQNLVLGLFCLAAWIHYYDGKYWWHSMLVISALALSCLYQALFMFPYTPLAKKDVPDASPGQNDEKDSIKVVIANVLMTNTKTGRLFKEIRAVDPDVVLFVEVDDKWIERLKPLESDYCFRLKRPQNNYYGMALYSRLPLVDPEVRFLVQKEVPSIHTNLRLQSGRLVRFVGVHPQPPGPTGDDRSIERDAELLIVGKMVRNLELPVIVAGDLNDVAWSRSTTLFLRVSELWDPRRGRGFYNTFNANIPFLMRWSLDHIFHSRHFSLKTLQKLPYNGSDHFPVFVHLQCDETAKFRSPSSACACEKHSKTHVKVQHAAAAHAREKLSNLASMASTDCRLALTKQDVSDVDELLKEASMRSAPVPRPEHKLRESSGKMMSWWIGLWGG